MAEHLDAYEIIRFALDHDAFPTAQQREHLYRCAQCRQELEQLRAVVRCARAASTDDIVTAPPESVWRAIAAELDLASGSEPEAKRRLSREPEDKPETGGESVPRRNVLFHDRTWLSRPSLLVAILSLLMGAALGSVVTRWQFDGESPNADMSRTTRLSSLAVPDATGTVRLLQGPEASQKVMVAVEGLPKTDGYYEVWLMDRSHKKLIAMGALGRNGTAVLPIPEGIDLSGYPLLDVSAQADNGNPAHSGESVVRGSLPG
ncbi:anti-sigma factor domain-containing protein [Streptomyces sp. NPDC001443]